MQPASGVPIPSRRMRALVVGAPPEGTRVESVPWPAAASGQVLVRVIAAGVNRADVMIRDGALDHPLGGNRGLGRECAGTVVETGSRERRWRVGDFVCGVTEEGAFAEVAVARSDHLMPVPAALGPAQAAAVPIAAATTVAHLIGLARLRPGDAVLIHGGASGFGSLAVQIARHLGLRVIATAGTDEKVALCRRLGATAVNHRSADFVAATLDVTRGRGVKAVLDVVGGPYLDRNIACLASHGRLISIGYQGDWTGTVDLRGLQSRLATITAASFSRQSPRRRAQVLRSVESRIWPLLASGHIRPLVHGLYGLEDIASAFGALGGDEVMGKLVVSPVWAGPPASAAAVAWPTPTGDE